MKVSCLMAKYLLIGAVGGPNFGDEIILSAWIKAIREADNDAEILCDGYNPDNVAQFVGGDVYTLKSDESLWACTYSVVPDQEQKSSSSWRSIHDGFREPSRAWKAINCVDALAHYNIDQIHIIGGGYLNALWPANYILLLLARLLAWRSAARIIATGLGLSPVKSEDISGLTGILSTFDYVDVRDTESYELLKMSVPEHLSFSGDDALLFIHDGPPKYPLQNIGVPTLVICLQNDLFPGDHIVSDLFSPASMELLKTHGIHNIVYAAAMSADVAGPSTELRSVLENHGFSISSLDPRQLTESGFPVSDGGLVITSRYHPHFLASLSGYSGVALSTTGYYDTKHKAVRKMGSNWPVLNNDLDVDIYSAMSNELNRKLPTFNKTARDSFVSKKKKMEHAIFAPHEKPNALPIDFIDIWSNNLRLLENSNRHCEDIRAEREETQKLYAQQLESNSELLSQLNNLQAKLDAMLAEVERISEELKQEKTARNLILNSRAWKITAPLRWFFALFK